MITLDEALRPIKMTCARCGGPMVVYPDAEQGKGCCPKCSPLWLKGFAVFCMNQERLKRGLGLVEEA